MEVFLDSNDLSASPHLWSSIVVSLDASEWFVLLASPGSAGSKWVGQEISHWLSDSDRHERFLIVLTSGRMQWSDGDFTDDSDAVHPALRGLLSEEPHYVDMTQVDRSIVLDLRNPLFKERVATVASAIRGISVGDLIGEDTRQFRLARRLRRIAVVSLAALTVGALVASVVAFQQRSEAIAQTAAAKQATEAAESAKREADDNAAQSRSRELAALALNTMAEDPVVAMLVAVEANYPGDAEVPIDVVEARNALGVTSRNIQAATLLKTGPRITAPTTDILRADSRFIATANTVNGTIDAAGNWVAPSWWDATTGAAVDSPVSSDEERRMMEPFGRLFQNESAASTVPFTIGATPVTTPFDIDVATDLLVGVDGPTHSLIVQTYVGGEVVARMPMPPTTGLTSVELLGPDRVVGVSGEGDLYVWQIRPGALGQVKTMSRQVQALTPIDDRHVLLVGAPSSIDPSTGERRVFSDLTTMDIVDITKDGDRMFTKSFDTNTLFSADALRVSPGGAYVAVVEFADRFNSPVRIWRLSTGRPVATLDAGVVNDIRWVDDSTLAVASSRGVEQFRLNPLSGIVGGSFAALASAENSPDVAVRTAVESFPDPADTQFWTLDHRPDPSAPSIQSVDDGPVDAATPGSVAISPDGSTIAGLLLEIQSGQPFPVPFGVVVDAAVGGERLAAFPGGRGVAFDSTGASLAVGVPNGVLIVDTATFETVRTLPVDGMTPEQILWLGDDGRLLVSGRDQGLGITAQTHVIDADDGAVVGSLRDDVVTFTLSRDGTVLAVAVAGGEVDLFPVAEDGTVGELLGAVVADPAEVTGLSFNANGTLLATSGPWRSVIWDVRTRAAPRPIQVLTDLPAWQPGDPVESDIVGVSTSSKGTWGLVLFRSDGRSMILAGGSGLVELPDFDPVSACDRATPADLAAVESVLGRPSACTRVSALRS